MKTLLCLILLWAGTSCAEPDDELAQSFAQPPAGAKPLTWWHWLNGTITRNGITRDLEAMQRAGLGGDCG